MDDVGGVDEDGGGVDGGGVESADEDPLKEELVGLESFTFREFGRGKRGIGSFVCTGVTEKTKHSDRRRYILWQIRTRCRCCLSCELCCHGHSKHNACRLPHALSKFFGSFLRGRLRYR